MKATKKILSLVLCFMMLVSAMPLHAFAAEEGNVTNGTYSGDTWSAGGTGSITHTINGTEVELSKTAVPVEGMVNTFDITLQVTTKTHTTQVTPGGAVVLVIDESNSMDDCATCGAGWYNFHEQSCPNESLLVNNYNETRMYAAQEAAKSFLKTYAGTDASANRMLAIVTFATGYTTELNWINVAGGAGKNGYNSALSAIDKLATDGGTNLEGGLHQALQELGKDAIKGVDAPSVVLLTDGAPTYRINGGNGSSGSKENNDAAAAKATAIKNAGAEIYTVCFGAADDRTYGNGPTMGEFLKNSISSGSDFAYNADNANEVADAFESITEDIVEGLDGNGWTATDPMPAYIDVTGNVPANFTSSNGQDYTWELSDPEVIKNGDDTTYIYTLTYRIVLDVQVPGFVEGQYYPSNEPTTLNIGDEHYAFPVPGVKGVLPRTDVSVTKVWEDDNNRDGMRTDSVTLQLHKDGTAIGEPVVLSAANNWSYTWTDLIEMSGGVEHAYTVVETEVKGYDPVYAANGTALTVTNVHKSETKDITVTKVWDDAENQDGKRPASIEVQLLAGGEACGEPVVLNEENKWSYTWEGLFVNENGQAIAYTVAEVNVPEGYESSVEDFVITNTYEPETITISGSKTWEDADNQDGIRPESITVNLKAGEEVVATATVTEAEQWSWTFTDLPKYAAGEEIEYTIAEVEVEGYTTKVEGYNITNTHVPEVITVAGEKTWDDDNNRDGIRPESITVNLMAGEKVVATATVTEANGWAWSFADMPKYENGTEIVYTVAEETVESYTAAVDGYNVTNTYAPAVQDITVTKVWDDAENQDGKRPASIEVQLLAGGEAYGEAVVLSEENKWTYTWEDLYVNEKGQEIVYTVAEVEVPEGYESSVEDFVITNTYEPETITISGSKTWEDADNQDGIRPESITVNLKAGEEVVATATVTEAEQWSWTFTDLPKYAAGEEIEYTIAEMEVEGYTTKVEGYNITNTHVPEVITVAGEKTWDDEDNRDGIRPESITVNLKAGEEVVATATVTEANGWAWSFADMPKYENGTEIVYTVAEETVESYTAAVDGYNVTNTYAPAVQDITVTKVWDDAENQDGKRPASIEVQLLAGGEAYGEAVVLSEENKWTYTWEDLYVNEKGQAIVYTVDEVEVPEGYESSVKDFVITNTHTPELITVAGQKTWDDEEDHDGFRPESITINLMVGEEVIKTATVTAEENWSWSFEDLAKYADGEVIPYTIEEVAVEGYETTVDGYNVTNSYVPPRKGITVTKVWDDADNQDGKRPASIKIQLLANGEPCGDVVILSEENKWANTWEDLYVYEGGEEIEYTVAEVEVPEGYESSVEDFVITNYYKPETIDITGSKTWEDADNQDGIRPESITVNLKAGEEVVATATVTEAEKWTWSFTELPKFANGTEIAYTIEEEAVEGYEATVNGFDIVNTHVPSTVGVEVKKVWNDNSDMYKIRPVSVTIVLVADGAETDKTLKLNADNGWTGSFTDLPEKAGGKAIVYTVKELDVEGYSSSVSGDAAKGFTVTNDLILIPETGDETNILGYGLVMGVSLVALIGVIVLMINNKKRYNK